MEQDRDAREAGLSGIGYRLAAPALRARQRQTVNQAMLDFADPGWDTGLRAPDLGEVAQDRWRASEVPALSFTAVLDQIRDVPWHTHLATVRRVSLVGLMGAAGFAIVLYQALPRPASKGAPKAEELAFSGAMPEAPSAPPATAPAPLAAAPLAAAPLAATPLASVPQPSIPSASESAASATAETPILTSAPADPAAAPPVGVADSKARVLPEATPPAAIVQGQASQAPAAARPIAPAQAAPRLVAKRPAVPHRVVKQPVLLAAQAPVRVSAPARPRAPAWHPMPRWVPAAFARALPRQVPWHHTVEAKAELPRWLTETQAAKPSALVMSDPPHNLALPPGLPHQAPATEPARVQGVVLPALRQPAYYNAPYTPSNTPQHYSGVYYGGSVPAPMPSNPQG